jgi:hypothetical protein
LNLTLKIALGVIFAIIIAFSILVMVDFSHYYLIQNDVKEFSKESDSQQPEKIIQTKFLSQYFEPNQNKIFLIGSSQIKPLNTTHIQEQLSKNNQDFEVYNLGAGADSPQERLKNIDLLISSKPKIVVYGIAYRDFMDQSPLEQSETKPISLLPDPHDFFNEISTKLFSSYDLEFMENPKLVTLTILKSLKYNVNESIENKTNENNLLVRPYPNAFFNENTNDVPKNDADLRNAFFVEGVTFNKIGNYDKNVNVIAFKEIITKLQQNNIEIIIFITPQSKYYLDAMPSSAKVAFDTLIKNIEKDHKIKIYFLLDKYKDLDIWYNAQHVAIFNNTQIYSTDISNIISGMYP